MKFKFDSKSLTFKLGIYFALFAALLMLVLWFLQIFFLRAYYEEMKISETRKIANKIIAQYEEPDILDTISSISYKNDMYIHIETSDGTIIFSPSSNMIARPSFEYMKEMPAVRDRLRHGSSNTTSIIMPDRRNNTNTLAFGAFLDNSQGREVILYIFSPLYPVESTVDILANQLIYVTIISLILAFGLSFIISNRITKPIVNITNSASKLAEGNHNVSFSGGNYSEIIRLADTLNFTSKELTKAENLQKDLIANVSHDLRTPLTMIKSYAEMIRDLSGDNSEKRKAHIQVIIEEAERLNLLVGDLLVLSKMHSGVETLHPSVFNIRETILSILNSYALYVEQEGYHINFICDADSYISGDEIRLKQVISNLVDNAIRYCGDDKIITISLKEVNEYVRFEVSDNGKGIPKEELDHIWERYYKASTNHMREISGTGLGLSIVKEILLLHHAKFGVESTLGFGSTFWFQLRNENSN